MFARPSSSRFQNLLPISTLLLLGLIGFAEATFAGTGRLLSPWMSRAPQIDGQITASEWDAAKLVDLGAGVTLRIGNDARTLYLAVLDSEDLTYRNDNELRLFFDDEGGVAPVLDDGAWTNTDCRTVPDLGEGQVVFPWDQGVYFGEIVSQPIRMCFSSGIADRTSFHSALRPEGVTYEMALPLDGPVALRVGPGERVGVHFRLRRDGIYVACLPTCSAFNPPLPADFRNLILASGGCNTGPQTFNSGLPLDWTSLIFVGSGQGWQQSSLFADPVFCQDNVTGGSGTSACTANALYTSAYTEADLHMPFPVTGQSTATVRFLASLEQGALFDTFLATVLQEVPPNQNLLWWQANHAGQPVELQLDLLSPPYLGNPPIELGFGHITTTQGGVEGGYAQIDDVELLCRPVLFADGFESGLTTHWSATAP